MAHHAARLRPAASFLIFAGQPEKPFGTQQPSVFPVLVDKVVKALWMKRASSLPGHGRDTVLFGFWYMFTAQLLQPAWCLGRLIEVEQPGVEDPCQRHLAHDHGYDLRPGIEAAQNGDEFFALMLADQVDLAQQQYICELDLFDQQITDRPLVFFAQRFTTAGQALCCLIVAQEVQAIDHGDHGVQSRHIGQTATQLVTESEGLSHWQWLRDTGGFDQQIIETSLFGQPCNLLKQVFAQRAANAAVAHLDQFLLSAVEADIALHLTGIDVDFTHIVDDYRHPQVVAVAQHMVEQRALAGAQKAGQHGDGKTIGHGEPLQADAFEAMHCTML
ncbi:hypothetical protein D9M71_470830 [compost metagenome]